MLTFDSKPKAEDWCQEEHTAGGPSVAQQKRACNARMGRTEGRPLCARGTGKAAIEAAETRLHGCLDRGAGRAKGGLCFFSLPSFGIHVVSLLLSSPFFQNLVARAPICAFIFSFRQERSRCSFLVLGLSDSALNEMLCIQSEGNNKRKSRSCTRRFSRLSFSAASSIGAEIDKESVPLRSKRKKMLSRQWRIFSV